MKDLTGQRFGRLVALQPTDKRVDQLVVWRCRCDCGREVEVVGSSLAKGNTQSCGCLRDERRMADISGERFGRLVALRPTEKRVRGSVVWECACDCGNFAEAPVASLRSGQVKSCGCLRRKGAAKDLAGQRFGRLVAEKPVGRRGRSVLWECRCDCGNVKQATTNQLTSGKVRSCGCLRRQARRPREDLTGRRFGRLVVIGPASEVPASTSVAPAGTDARMGVPTGEADTLRGAPTGGAPTGIPGTADARMGLPTGNETIHVSSNAFSNKAPTATVATVGPPLWRCRCDCGNEVNVSTASLNSGNTRSCGCLHRDSVRRDIAGKRFGKLVAVRPTGENRSGSAVWECACDCGNTCEETARRLVDGTAASCGCDPAPRLPRNLAGRRFGRLTAIEPTDERDYGSVVWRCVCECGTFTNVSRRRLQDGTATSCGCE